MIFPALAVTQRVPGVADSVGARPSSQVPVSLGAVLPSTHTLGAPPAVSDVGQLLGADDTRRTVPATPALALADITMYDDDLMSLFPSSVLSYPADSLRALRAHRAVTWIDRLARDTSVMRGRQAITMAQVAVRATYDTMACRLIDHRLAELAPGRSVAPGERSVIVERSLTLGAAVAMLTDSAIDSARRASTLAMARRYAAQLAAIPRTGWSTRSDSTIILYRQLDAATTLLRAAVAPPAVVVSIADVLALSDRLLSLVPTLGLAERPIALSDYPYDDVAAILTVQPGGRTQLDSLDAQLLRLAAPRDVELPAGLSETQRADRRRSSQARMRDRLASFALIGRPAPPIRAHAWLNTSDSLYTPDPRAQTWHDGVTHVVLFGDRELESLALLESVHRAAVDGVRVLFVTTTEGHIGPDLATPAEEVEWLRGYYRTVRDVSVPIALWAGARVPGPLGTHVVERSPADADYHVMALPVGTCVLIGGDGIVLAYAPLRTRADAVALIGQLRYLHASGSPHGPSSP